MSTSNRKGPRSIPEELLDSILEGDCVESLQSLPDESVDLIFADPPYNLQLRNDLHRPNLTQVDAVDDHWDKFDDLHAYDEFTRAWLRGCRRVLKRTGTLWVIGSYHNIYRVGAILQDLGYWILNDVVWVKSNPMPNFRGVRFCNAHETLLWAKRSEDDSRYTFNYAALKAGNEDLQLRSDWYLPVCRGEERLREEGSKVHSTQKPEALLHRIIRACSNPGDVVLDPFFGSGTTGAVAKRLGRHFVGLEREPAYIDAARRRIEAVSPVDPSALVEEPKVERLPFSLLLELGLLREGDRLWLSRTGHTATVAADGRLCSDGEFGSIHRLGAKLMKAPACNGWEHWQYLDPAMGKLLPLDELRRRARAMLREPAPGSESPSEALEVAGQELPGGCVVELVAAGEDDESKSVLPAQLPIVFG